MWITLTKSNDKKPDSPIDVNMNSVAYFEPKYACNDEKKVYGSRLVLTDDDANTISVIEFPAQIRSLIAAAKAGAV